MPNYTLFQAQNALRDEPKPAPPAKKENRVFLSVERASAETLSVVAEMPYNAASELKIEVLAVDSTGAGGARGIITIPKGQSMWGIDLTDERSSQAVILSVTPASDDTYIYY